MDNDTRYLPPTDAARVPVGTQTPSDPVGSPTTYLPPVPAPRDARTETPTTYAAPPPTTNVDGSWRSAPPVSGMAPWAPTAGPVLLGVGLLMVLMSGYGTHIVGAMFPFALGLIFLYVSRQAKSPVQELGFRIPGSILTGLGAGIILGGPWAAVGLGLGFAALWYADRRQWWWLIPAAAVGIGGLDGVIATTSLFNFNGLIPVALILFGAYLIREHRLLAHR